MTLYSLGSVSYTHLYVILCTGLGTHGIMPVSYTHLDVYKRQVVYVVNKNCFNNCFNAFLKHYIFYLFLYNVFGEVRYKLVSFTRFPHYTL